MHVLARGINCKQQYSYCKPPTMLQYMLWLIRKGGSLSIVETVFPIEVVRRGLDEEEKEDDDDEEDQLKEEKVQLGLPFK